MKLSNALKKFENLKLEVGNFNCNNYFVKANGHVISFFSNSDQTVSFFSVRDEKFENDISTDSFYSSHFDTLKWALKFVGLA